MLCSFAEARQETALNDGFHSLKLLLSELQSLHTDLLDMARLFGIDYTQHFRLKATLTLVVENLFSCLKREATMPTCVQLAVQFSIVIMEMVKSTISCGYHFRTSSKTWYPRVLGCLPPRLRFSPSIFPRKQPAPKVDYEGYRRLKAYCKEFLRRSKQRSVRSAYSKHAPGTLPLHAYAVAHVHEGTMDFASGTFAVAADKPAAKQKRKRHERKADNPMQADGDIVLHSESDDEEETETKVDLGNAIVVVPGTAAPAEAESQPFFLVLPDSLTDSTAAQIVASSDALWFVAESRNKHVSCFNAKLDRVRSMTCCTSHCCAGVDLNEAQSCGLSVCAR